MEAHPTIDLIHAEVRMVGMLVKRGCEKGAGRQVSQVAGCVGGECSPVESQAAWAQCTSDLVAES